MLVCVNLHSRNVRDKIFLMNIRARLTVSADIVSAQHDVDMACFLRILVRAPHTATLTSVCVVHKKPRQVGGMVFADPAVIWNV